MPRKCACGCDGEPSRGRFLRGHQWRDPEILAKRMVKVRGSRWTDEQRARLSEQRRGRRLTAEQRAAVARGRIAGWQEPYYTVEDRGYETPCWVWARAMLKTGYGAVRREGKTLRAHRWMYEQHRGAVPAGLILDHLCEVKACVNPDHLDPVTRSVNQLRHWARLRARAAA